MTTSLRVVGLAFVLLTVGLTLWSGISYFAKNWDLVSDLGLGARSSGVAESGVGMSRKAFADPATPATPELLTPDLEFFVEMAAGAEVAVGNLKNLRGDRPWIVVVQAVHQGGKGLDIGGQSREKENGPAIRNRKKAVRSEQIRVAIAKVRQEQNRR